MSSVNRYFHFALFLAIGLIAMSTVAQAGPLSGLRSKIKERFHKEPTQVQQQDSPCASCTGSSCQVKERSLLRRQPSAAASAHPPSGQPAASHDAPKAPAEKGEKAPKETAARGAAFIRQSKCECLSGQRCTCGEHCSCEK